MKKGVTFFCIYLSSLFSMFRRAQENVSDPSEERKLRLRIPKLLIGHQKNRNKHRTNIGTNGGACERRETFRTN